MPYADPEVQKAVMRVRYRERYEKERGFADKESRRKAAYYAENSRYRNRVKLKSGLRKKAK
jgi:hypothetical protein